MSLLDFCESRSSKETAEKSIEFGKTTFQSDSFCLVQVCKDVESSIFKRKKNNHIKKLRAPCGLA